MARIPLFAGVLMPLILLGGSAAADPETDQLREQLRATVLQLRQLQDQQASAPAPAPAAALDAGSKARLGALQSQLRAARRGAAKAATLQAALDKAQADNSALTTAAAASATQIAALTTANAQVSDQLKAATAERDKVKAELALMTTIAKACLVKNNKLTAFSRSLIDDLTRVTLADVVARQEPLLGLARTRLENLTQDREDMVRAAHCDPAVDAMAPAHPAG
jgi:chromosome segregation ATPase